MTSRPLVAPSPVGAVLACCLAVLPVLAVAQTPVAVTLADFRAGFAGAWAHYRAAVFYLDTGNPAVAALELAELAESWQRLTAHSVPAPFDADPQFSDDLQSAGAAFAAALAAAEQGAVESARAALAPVRGRLAAARARNGVVFFSDAVDEANRAFAALWGFRRDFPAVGDGAALDRMRAAVAVARYVWERCDRAAAATVRGDAEFRRIIDGALASFDQLWPALRAGDEMRAINILRELHAFDGLLFLKFG
ncbi:MAG: hypothetical protein GC191_07360 [Azospirillum sp.]|nr:hypothetical protein [Azospirillum sp.]